MNGAQHFKTFGPDQYFFLNFFKDSSLDADKELQ
jgi:hypothetical protein